MSLCKPLLLRHSIEIKASPEKIWEFFVHLEENYKSWHPEDHIVFKWVKGTPMETGSRYYGEEIMNGKVKKFKGTVGTVIPKRKIIFHFTFPVTLVSPYFNGELNPRENIQCLLQLQLLDANDFIVHYWGKKDGMN